MVVEMKNKFIWFFRLEGGGNQCTDYPTKNESGAIERLFSEYGRRATGAVRRELTSDEYHALLRCNFEGQGNQIYQAIQDLFYRIDPRKEPT